MGRGQEMGISARVVSLVTSMTLDLLQFPCINYIEPTSLTKADEDDLQKLY